MLISSLKHACGRRGTGGPPVRWFVILSDACAFPCRVSGMCGGGRATAHGCTAPERCSLCTLFAFASTTPYLCSWGMGGAARGRRAVDTELCPLRGPQKTVRKDKITRSSYVVMAHSERCTQRNLAEVCSASGMFYISIPLAVYHRLYFHTTGYISIKN